MIHIIRDQELMGNPNLKIASPTGNYEDTALIDFYNIYNPEITAGAFQAQFVKYGGMVYQFNEPKELGEAILIIDPESTHSAADFARMNIELSKQMKEGTLESKSLEKMKEKINEEKKEEEEIEEEIEQEIKEEELKPAPISNEKPTDFQELKEEEMENFIETSAPKILNFRDFNNARKKIVKKPKKII